MFREAWRPAPEACMNIASFVLKIRFQLDCILGCTVHPVPPVPLHASNERGESCLVLEGSQSEDVDVVISYEAAILEARAVVDQVLRFLAQDPGVLQIVELASNPRGAAPHSALAVTRSGRKATHSVYSVRQQRILNLSHRLAKAGGLRCLMARLCRKGTMSCRKGTMCSR